MSTNEAIERGSALARLGDFISLTKPRVMSLLLVSAVTGAFLGSGTTLIAAERTGRVCYGLELDPHYCRIAIARWESFTGLKAEKEGKTR